MKKLVFYKKRRVVSIITKKTGSVKTLFFILVFANLFILPFFATAESTQTFASTQDSSELFFGSWGKVSVIDGVDGYEPEIMVKEASQTISSTVNHNESSYALIVIANIFALLIFYFIKDLKLTKSNFWHLSVVLLVVMIPVYTSEVFASGVTKISISGKDGYGEASYGFRRYWNDEVTVKVDGAVDGDTNLTTSQMKFFFDGSGVGYTGACSGGAVLSCEYTSPTTTYAGDHYYLVRVYDDSGNPAAQAMMDIYTDNLEPKVTVSKSASILGSGGSITLYWNVKDVRNNAGNCGVGIKEISILKDDFNGDVLEKPSANGECELSGEFTIDSSNSDSGENTICIEAIDMFDKTSNDNKNCITYTYDPEPPRAESAEIYYPGTDDELTHMADGFKNFEIKVNVTGELDDDTVLLDLSAFGLGNVTPTHIQQSNSRHLFTYSGRARISQTFDAQVIVYGEDSAGNQVNPNTVSAGTIGWDNTGPKFTQIYSNHGNEDGKMIMGDVTNITAVITENYLEYEDIWLLFVAEDYSQKSLNAQECNKTGSGWECYWRYEALSAYLDEGLYNVSGDLVRSSDIFHNMGNDTITQAATADFSIPVKVEVNISAHHHAPEKYGDAIVENDSLEIKLYINDSSEDIKAYVDLAHIITGMDEVEGTCEKNPENNSDHICFWITDPIDNPLPLATLFFDVEDSHGNINKDIYHDFEILDIYGTAEPRNWRIESIKCSPDLVDRQVTTLSTQRVYCNVKFESASGSGSVDMLTINMGECENVSSDVDVEKYTANIEQLETENKTDQWVKIELANIEMDIDTLPMKCPFVIYSKTSRGVEENAEYANATIEIKFYNQPMGQLDKNLEKEIEKAYDDATGTLYEIIGALKKIVDVMQDICSLWGVWWNIMATYDLLASGFESIEVAASANEGVSSLAYNLKSKGCLSVKEGSQWGSDTYNKWFSEACGFVNCKYVPFSDKANDKTALGKFSFGFEDVKLDDDYFNYLNPTADQKPNSRNSLILSVIGRCIPGIIYNLEKYRQIQCMYAYCLNNSATSGLDMSYCKELKQQATCKFVVGELIYGMPWGGLAAYIDQISNWMSNPLNIIGTAWSSSCNLCKEKKWGQAAQVSCKLYFFTTMVSQSIAEVIGFIDADEMNIETDFCELMESDSENSII